MPKYKRHDLKVMISGFSITDHFTLNLAIIYSDGTSETPCSSSPERRVQKGKFKYQVRPIDDVTEKSCFIEFGDSVDQTGDNKSKVTFITNYMIYAKEGALELEISVMSGEEKSNVTIKTEKIPL